MSSFQNSISHRAHKERSQLDERKKFGLLEKHKDYVIRCRAYHKKEETLRKLKEKAASRNPDEFYFKMVNTKVVGGEHRPVNAANKYSHDELMLMKTQDIGYVLQKIQSQKKKIQRMSSVLHFLDNRAPNKHVYFAEDRDEQKKINLSLSKKGKDPTFEDVPEAIKRKTGASYKELETRKEKLKELERVFMDMTLQKELMKKGRRRKLREDELTVPTAKPVYKWRYERKR